MEEVIKTVTVERAEDGRVVLVEERTTVTVVREIPLGEGDRFGEEQQFRLHFKDGKPIVLCEPGGEFVHATPIDKPGRYRIGPKFGHRIKDE